MFGLSIIILLGGLSILIFRGLSEDNKMKKPTELISGTQVINQASPLDFSKTNLEYPSNLLEGDIYGIVGTDVPVQLGVNVKIEKFFLEPPVSTRKIIFKIDEKTKITIWDFSTGEERPAKFEDLVLGDQVIGEIRGGDNRQALSQEEYIIDNLKKIIFSEPQD